MYYKPTTEQRQILMERVERGAKFLDGVRPDWYKSVEVENLYISSCTECVLGHVYGTYTEGIWSIHGGNRSSAIEMYNLCEQNQGWAINHGFYPDSMYMKLDGDDDFKTRASGILDERRWCSVDRPLSELWREYIKGRLLADDVKSGVVKVAVVS